MLDKQQLSFKLKRGVPPSSSSFLSVSVVIFDNDERQNSNTKTWQANKNILGVCLKCCTGHMIYLV